MISEELWLGVMAFIFLGNIIPALIRTYTNWRQLKESREYWNSWEKRQIDIARKVINGLDDETLIELAKKVEEVKK